MNIVLLLKNVRDSICLYGYRLLYFGGILPNTMVNMLRVKVTLCVCATGIRNSEWGLLGCYRYSRGYLVCALKDQLVPRESVSSNSVANVVFRHEVLRVRQFNSWWTKTFATYQVVWNRTVHAIAIVNGIHNLIHTSQQRSVIMV